jgi:hypothetical protein
MGWRLRRVGAPNPRSLNKEISSLPHSSSPADHVADPRFTRAVQHSATLPMAPSVYPRRPGLTKLIRTVDARRRSLHLPTYMLCLPAVHHCLKTLPVSQLPL